MDRLSYYSMWNLKMLSKRFPNVTDRGELVKILHSVENRICGPAKVLTEVQHLFGAGRDQRIERAKRVYEILKNLKKRRKHYVYKCR